MKNTMFDLSEVTN